MGTCPGHGRVAAEQVDDGQLSSELQREERGGGGGVRVGGGGILKDSWG